MGGAKPLLGSAILKVFELGRINHIARAGRGALRKMNTVVDSPSGEKGHSVHSNHMVYL